MDCSQSDYQRKRKKRYHFGPSHDPLRRGILEQFSCISCTESDHRRTWYSSNDLYSKKMKERKRLHARMGFHFLKARTGFSAVSTNP